MLKQVLRRWWKESIPWGGWKPEYKWWNLLLTGHIFHWKKKKKMQEKMNADWKVEAFPTGGFYFLKLRQGHQLKMRGGEKGCEIWGDVNTWMVNPETGIALPASVECSWEDWGHELKPVSLLYDWLTFLQQLLLFGFKKWESSAGAWFSPSKAEILSSKKGDIEIRVENVCKRGWKGLIREFKSGDLQNDYDRRRRRVEFF